MGATDRLQHNFEVGQVVNIPIRVTAIGGTTAQPTVTGTTKYAGFDGNTDVITTVDAIQVVLDQMTGPQP
jgi:hypothetical protein